MGKRARDERQGGQATDGAKHASQPSSPGAGRDGIDRQQQGQNVHGEGNYDASRKYNEATKAFANSGRVEPAARAAAPSDAADAREMANAEAEGRRHAKGEDPALDRRAKAAPDASPAPRPGKGEE